MNSTHSASRNRVIRHMQTTNFNNLSGIPRYLVFNYISKYFFVNNSYFSLLKIMSRKILTDVLNVVNTWKYPFCSSVATTSGGEEIFLKLLNEAKTIIAPTVVADTVIKSPGVKISSNCQTPLNQLTQTKA